MQPPPTTRPWKVAAYKVMGMWVNTPTLYALGISVID
jgi:hypothetical protein